ncbi:MAG: FHA domain-containing protein [Anaerolineae bacterium]|nr:FHA domain-containing protein [Anaerolineae bacterium]
MAGAEVAPQHALIRYGRGRYYLQNQAEAGRTLLNGSPVSATPLIHGDRISVGGVEFVFQQEEREARSVVERTR